MLLHYIIRMETNHHIYATTNFKTPVGIFAGLSLVRLLCKTAYKKNREGPFIPKPGSLPHLMIKKRSELQP